MWGGSRQASKVKEEVSWGSDHDPGPGVLIASLEGEQREAGGLGV